MRISDWSSDVCSSDLPTLQAAFAAPAPWIFGAVEIVLPDYNLRLLDGASEPTINGNLYKGEDATFGTLAAISNLSDEIGEEAPEVSIELYPPNASAMATLCKDRKSVVEGKRVSVSVELGVRRSINKKTSNITA